MLAKAVLARCDKLDRLEDGIISRPAACGYDPTELRCTDGADTGNSCLSDTQIATVKTVMSPIATNDSTWSHPGYNFGAENSAKGWGEYVWPSASFLGGNSAQGGFSDGFIRSFVTRDPSFDTKTWDANYWLPSLSPAGALCQAFNPDLSGLKARGAKLILWKDTNDTAISPRDTQRYYNRVVEKMGRDASDETVELFLAPAGPDPTRSTSLKALSTWVESATPASRQNLVLTKKDKSGEPVMTRPMCRYPAWPRYKGRGDVNVASSFECSME